MTEDLREKLGRLVLVVPSLNPDEKLVNTVRGMAEAGFPRILVVNDGSSAEHLWPFEEIRRLPEVTYIGYEVNKGKGGALKTAFRYVLDNFPDAEGVVTVDGDGQHTPPDTVSTALALLEHPEDLIMGCRNFRKAGVPTHNMLGNTITIAVMKLFFGISLSDTQTGLRGIAAGYLPGFLTIEGSRFEYESNMLYYAKEHGIDFFEVEISTLYIDDNKSSHFRVITDSARIYKPVLLYLCSSLGSTVIDVVLFTLLNLLVFAGLGDRPRLFLAIAIARICSSLFNYTCNRKAVFRSKSPAGKTMARYYILCACQMLCSWILVTLLTTATSAAGLWQTLIKVVVDCCLFVASFRIQRYWVFKD